MIKGITIQLYKKTESSRDALNNPVYTTEVIDVDNVLVGSPTDEEVVNELNLTGRRISYVLGIPKGDQNEWENVEVEFFGKRFKTFGMPVEGIEDMIPLRWNKKVKVEAFNRE